MIKNTAVKVLERCIYEKVSPHQLTQNDSYSVEDIGLWRKIIIGTTCCRVIVKYRKPLKTVPTLALNNHDAVTNKKVAQGPAQNPEMRQHKQENRPDQELTDR